MSSITDPRTASPELQYFVEESRSEEEEKKVVAGRSKLSFFHTGDEHTMN